MKILAIQNLFLSTALLLLGACSGLSVNGIVNFKGVPQVDNIDRLSAAPREEVTANGKNLSELVEVKVDDVPVTFSLVSATEAKFEMPAILGTGLINVKFSLKGKTINVIPILNAVTVETLTALTVKPENICETIIFKGGNGKLVRGQGKCRPDCTADGQTDCIATKALPSVTASVLESKLSAGEKIGKVIGKNTTQSQECEQP